MIYACRAKRNAAGCVNRISSLIRPLIRIPLPIRIGAAVIGKTLTRRRRRT